MEAEKVNQDKTFSQRRTEIPYKAVKDIGEGKDKSEEKACRNGEAVPPKKLI